MTVCDEGCHQTVVFDLHLAHQTPTERHAFMVHQRTPSQHDNEKDWSGRGLSMLHRVRSRLNVDSFFSVQKLLYIG